MKVNNLMLLSLLNKNVQFFHACQLSTKVNNLMLPSLFNKTPSSSMPASSGMVLSSKVKNLMLLSLLNKNFQFFHACQLWHGAEHEGQESYATIPLKEKFPVLPCLPALAWC
jgi:hypothetical protein